MITKIEVKNLSAKELERLKTNYQVIQESKETICVKGRHPKGETLNEMNDNYK